MGYLPSETPHDWPDIMNIINASLVQTAMPLNTAHSPLFANTTGHPPRSTKDNRHECQRNKSNEWRAPGEMAMPNPENPTVDERMAELPMPVKLWYRG